jgi:solute carrier family 25 uncoupling protein 8/9
LKGVKDGLKSFGASAAATSWGEAVTIPFDTIKVRLQTQAAGATKYSGLFGTGATVAKEEGLGSLWKGLTPGIHRQILFGGLRFGLYEPVRDFYTKTLCGKDYTGTPPFAVKLMSGLTTGALAIAVASPTDLVKVRMQSQTAVAGVAPKYPNALAAYGIILKEEGLGAMWNGVVPNMMRNAIISAIELGTYDQFKEELLKMGMPDGVPVQTASAFATGLVSVGVGSPVDVMKSRMMSDKTGQYKSFLDCASKTLANDGPGAFYKGFSPNFARAGSWCVVSFLTLEQIKEMTGLKQKV